MNHCRLGFFFLLIFSINNFCFNVPNAFSAVTAICPEGSNSSCPSETPNRCDNGTCLAQCLVDEIFNAGSCQCVSGKPTVVIESRIQVTTNKGTQSGQTPTGINLTIIFSEAVTGFARSDISISNGATSSFSGSGNTYTVTATPSAAGTMTVTVPANVAVSGSQVSNSASSAFVARIFTNGTPIKDVVAAHPDYGPYGSSYGVKYTAASAQKVCEYAGFTSVHAKGSRTWDSPGDNDTIKWYSNSWVHENGSSSNSDFINLLQCVNSTYY